MIVQIHHVYTINCLLSFLGKLFIYLKISLLNSVKFTKGQKTVSVLTKNGFLKTTYL